MKISYGITVHNEHEEIERLLKLLVKYKDEDDEIVIVDDHSDYQCWRVFDEYIHDQYPNIFFHEKSLNSHNPDFAKHKNFVIEQCTGDYVFHLDADEYPNEILLQQLKQVLDMNPVDLIWVPRINTVDGITQEHLNAWGWRTTENGWINYPDYQSRVFRRDSEIRWSRPVHEQIVGCKTYAHLPPQEELSLYHPKTIEKQMNQNNMYVKAMR